MVGISDSEWKLTSRFRLTPITFDSCDHLLYLQKTSSNPIWIVWYILNVSIEVSPLDERWNTGDGQGCEAEFWLPFEGLLLRNEIQ